LDHESSKAILDRLNESLDFEKRRLELLSFNDYKQKSTNHDTVLHERWTSPNPLQSESNVGSKSDERKPHHTSPKLQYLNTTEGSMGLKKQDDPRMDATVTYDQLNTSRIQPPATNNQLPEGLGESADYLKEKVWDEDWEWKQAIKEVRAEMNEALIQKENEEREKQIQKFLSGELAKLEQILMRKHQAEVDRMKHNLEHAFERSATKSITELQNELHYSSRDQEKQLQTKWKEELKAALEELEETFAEMTKREEEILKEEEDLYRTEALVKLQDRLEQETRHQLEQERLLLTQQLQEKREQLETALQEQVSASLTSLELALDEDQQRQEQQMRAKTSHQLEETLEKKFGQGMEETETRLEKSINQAQHGYYALLREMDSSLKAISLLSLVPNGLLKERLAEEKVFLQGGKAPAPLRKAARIYQFLMDCYEINSEKLGSQAQRVLKMRQQPNLSRVIHQQKHGKRNDNIMDEASRHKNNSLFANTSESSFKEKKNRHKVSFLGGGAGSMLSFF